MSEDREEELRRAREQTVRNMKSISPSEFEKSIPPETAGMKIKRKWGKFKRILEAFGITGSSGTGGFNTSSANSTSSHSSNSDFRTSHKVNTPPQRTMEDWYIEHMNYEAYYKMVDGKGDDDCGHKH